MIPGPFRHGVLLLAIVLVAFGTTRAWRTWRHAAGIDFYQYWVVGRVLERGDIPSVYDHGSRAAIGQEFLRHALSSPSARQQAAARFRHVLEPMSTPFLFTALMPFALADYDTSFDAFLALSLAALLISVLVVGHVVGLASLDRMVVLAFIVFAFDPVAADLRVGNVGQLHLAMVALYIWLAAGRGTTRQVLAGVVLGAATTFKPSLAAVAPLLAVSWALARDWRRLAAQGSGLVAGGMGAVLLSAAVFGSFHAWMEWLTAVRTMPPMAIEAGNVSAQAVAERALGLRLGPLPAAIGGLAVVAARWTRLRVVAQRVPKGTPHDDLPVVAAGCLVFLISSPLVWLHYLILTLPAAMLLLGVQARWRWLAVVALTAVAMTPYVEPLGLDDAVARAVVVLGGVVILFALVLVEIAAPSQRDIGPVGRDAPAPSVL